MIGGVAVVALGATWFAINWTPAATPGPSLAPPPTSEVFAPPSLDPEFPAFPVPPDAVLVNAQVEGAGPAAYRVAAWRSPLDFAATVAFYTSPLGGWHLTASQPEPGSTLVTLADGSGIYARAEVLVSATMPVRIGLQLVPPGELAAPTAAVEGSPIAFGPLPAATSLPPDTPAWLVPTDASLLDAAYDGATLYAIWHSGAERTVLKDAYLAQLADSSPAVTDDSGAFSITFAGVKGSGQIVLQPAAAGGTDVFVALSR